MNRYGIRLHNTAYKEMRDFQANASFRHSQDTFALIPIPASSVVVEQCCGAGPILTGYGYRLRLRTTKFFDTSLSKKYSFENKNKFFFQCTVPIFTFNLCKNCYI